MIDEEPEGAIHLHIKHHCALSLLLPYWLRQRTGELWIQPDAAADLNRHGFALKSLQWCPLEETGERILVQFPAVDNICVAWTKTFDNLSLPVCSINGAFSIFQVIHTCVQKMTTTFSPNCPFACVTTWATWWGPSLGKCLTDVRETLPKWQMGNTQKGLTRTCVFGGPVSAFVLMNIEFMALSLFVCLFIFKVSKCLNRVPLKMSPSRINSRQSQLQGDGNSCLHILEGCCCKLLCLIPIPFLRFAVSWTHWCTYTNIEVHTHTYTHAPHTFSYLSCHLEIIVNLFIIHYYSIRITSANKH